MSEQAPQYRNDAGSKIEVCPNCEATRVRLESRRIEFKYGLGSKEAILSAEVPMHICEECGAEFTDEVAEKLRHSAVCRHLGLLTPQEIVAIRESAGMNRKQFAAATHIGMASLSRWENSEGLQNPALDRYMRLLARPNGMAALREIASETVAAERWVTETSVADVRVPGVAEAAPGRFRNIAKMDHTRQIQLSKQASCFSLSSAGLH